MRSSLLIMLKRHLMGDGVSVW